MIGPLSLKSLKPRIRIYGQELDKINGVVNSILGLHRKDIKVIRLPPYTRRLNLRQNYCGDGYSTYGKYQCKIHRVLIQLRDASLLSKVLALTGVSGVLLDARVA